MKRLRLNDHFVLVRRMSPYRNEIMKNSVRLVILVAALTGCSNSYRIPDTAVLRQEGSFSSIDIVTSAGPFRAYYVNTVRSDYDLSESPDGGGPEPKEADERVGAIVLVPLDNPTIEYLRSFIIPEKKMKIKIYRERHPTFEEVFEEHGDLPSIVVPTTEGSMFYYDGNSVHEIAGNCDLRCVQDKEFLQDFVGKLIADGKIEGD